VLQSVFGHDEFRRGQGAAVGAVLAGRDAVVLLPTGGGKSLCYQVPAVVSSESGEGPTIVVSPLIALMEDQVRALDGRGVRAAAIHSGMDSAAQREVSARFVRGDVELLYVSPEGAAIHSFRMMVSKVPMALLAMDEAHCLSQWGHDFRPEYMQLGALRAHADAPTIALTATATPRVMDEIVNVLGLEDPLLVRGDFERPNLRFSVQPLRQQAARIDSLVAMLDRIGLRGRVGKGRALVYCASRKKTETVAKALKAAGFSAGHYHAGRTKLARERAQKAFTLGRIRTLVATNAFGMGIDIPDVRLIVHFQTPGSLEAYYQEAGRAGRDGEDSECVLFFGKGDLVLQRRLQSDRSGHNAGALAAVEAYANGYACRQVVLCGHFTGSDAHEACGRCDVCDGAVELVELPAEAARSAAQVLDAAVQQTIVDAVGQLRRPVGKSKLAKALRGSRAKALKRYGLIDLPQHGTLKPHEEADIVATLDALLEDGRLVRKGVKYPTVWLPGRPVRATAAERAARPAAKRSRRPRYSPIARELENYRKRTARRLKWKPYMVFQRRVILAIDQKRPQTLADLERIPGLGQAKIERFGEDLLALVRAHRD